mgnify:CR=1 FL=1
MKRRAFHTALGFVFTLTALAVPLAPAPGGTSSLARATEHALHPWVAWGVLPLFAFVNAGVSLHGLSWSILLEPIPLGIAAAKPKGDEAPAARREDVAPPKQRHQRREPSEWPDEEETLRDRKSTRLNSSH